MIFSVILQRETNFRSPLRQYRERTQQETLRDASHSFSMTKKERNFNIYKKERVQIEICTLSLYPNIRLDYALALELTRYKLKLSIPILAKAADERFLEKLVYGEVLLPAL